MTKASEYRNLWIEKKYDRINLTVPKGKKAAIQAFAAQRGESVNAFLNRLVDEAMDQEQGSKEP